MPTTKTTTKTTDGLTAEERELLRDLQARAAAAEKGAEGRSLTARERVYAAALRDRDHLDGCPGTRPDGGARIEAYVEVSPAPSRGLAAAGVKPGDRVLVFRCLECSGMTHRPVPPSALDPVNDYVLRELEKRTADLADAELDGTLE